MAWLLILVPLAGAGAVLLAGRRPGSQVALATAATAVTLAVGLWAAAVQPTASWRWGPGLELGLAVEGLGRVMVVLVPAIAFPVVLFAGATADHRRKWYEATADHRREWYSAGLRHDPGLRRLLALLLAFVAAMLVLVAAGDLVVVLVGWELVAATSWALIAHDWRDPERPPAAAAAFLTTRLGDLGLVAAAGVALTTAGSAGYSGLASLRGWQAAVVAGGLLLAAATKSAQLPFSPWLFSAMAGPTPVSALLHSATMVAAGAYLLARTVPLLGGAPWLPTTVAGLGLATALAGGIVATAQTDLKRALAASTSAQYGLILVAIGAGSTAAAGAHLVTHAAFKSLLFLGAGVALHAAGTGWLGSMRLGRALPLTAVTFLAGALALGAVPPLGAARSKEEILAAAVHQSSWLAAGVVVAAFLSALYAGRLALLAFAPGPPRSEVARPTHAEQVALGLLAVATVALGALWLPGAGAVVEGLSGGRLAASEPWELAASLGGIAAAAAVLTLLARSDRLLSVSLPAPVQAWLSGWLGLPALARVVVVDPVLGLSRALAAFDDRVVDAGVRLAVAVAAGASRAFSSSWWGERSFDGAVLAVAGATLRAAGASRRADEVGVDGAVESVARGAGAAGRSSRRLQTGLSHFYYRLVAAGFVLVVAVAALWR
ncbi:MAG: NADH-quinone oxidoreductase subunit 5 family protein [Acidimicrobiales bacterium]